MKNAKRIKETVEKARKEAVKLIKTTAKENGIKGVLTIGDEIGLTLPVYGDNEFDPPFVETIDSKGNIVDSDDNKSTLEDYPTDFLILILENLEENY